MEEFINKEYMVRYGESKKWCVGNDRQLAVIRREYLFSQQILIE